MIKELYGETAAADLKIIEPVEAVTATRGVPQAQVALAWLMQKKK